MSSVILGYVLTVLACSKVDGEVTHDCTPLETRRVPTSLWVCNVKQADAVLRIPNVDVQDLGLPPGTYHFEFGCAPTGGSL